MQPFASADVTVAKAKIIATHPISAFADLHLGTRDDNSCRGLLFRDVVMSGVEIKLVRHKKAASRSPFLVLSCNNERWRPSRSWRLVAYDWSEGPVHPAFEHKH